MGNTITLTGRQILTDGDLKLHEIAIFLDKIKEESLNIDFRTPAGRRKMMERVFEVRTLYQAAEEFITKQPVQVVELKAFQIRAMRTIKQAQVAAWLDKIIKNIDTYLKQPGNDYGKQLDFLKNQYPLIDVILKVLNGQSYFVGIGQN